MSHGLFSKTIRKNYLYVEGQAITKKYLNANAPHALQLISWFRNVFESNFPES